jgi:hypothetical protein
MFDLSTPNEHAAARVAKAKPEAERTDADRRAIAWIDGRDRYYTGTAVHD